MLKHQGAPRQASPPSLPVDPGKAYPHPGILVFLQAQATGDVRCQVDSCGVEDFPAELVLALVEVLVVGNLRLWLATRNAFVHRAVNIPHPVIIVGVPGPSLLPPPPHRAPAADAPDANPRLAAEFEVAMRQSN